MHEHNLQWKSKPEGLLKVTTWGWLAKCKCGWEQDTLSGTKKLALRLYREHKK